MRQFSVLSKSFSWHLVILSGPKVLSDVLLWFWGEWMWFQGWREAMNVMSNLAVHVIFSNLIITIVWRKLWSWQNSCCHWNISVMTRHSSQCSSKEPEVHEALKCLNFCEYLFFNKSLPNMIPVIFCNTIVEFLWVGDTFRIDSGMLWIFWLDVLEAILIYHHRIISALINEMFLWKQKILIKTDLWIHIINIVFNCRIRELLNIIIVIFVVTEANGVSTNVRLSSIHFF